MLFLKFKNDFLNFIDSDYTCLDFLRFVQENPQAQSIIEKYYDDVNKVVQFIETTSDTEIESILNTAHAEYDDPDYGSLDPLGGWRIPSKKEIEDFDYYLQEGDDPLTWIMREIEDDKENLESNLEELLEFINGIPCVHGIRIGINMRQALINSIEHKAPNIFNYEFPIKYSYVIIDCEKNKNQTISSLSIHVPFEMCSQKLVQDLYEYISDNLPKNHHSATYSFDTSDKLSAVNIQVANSLYNITMDNDEHPIFGKSLLINISPQRTGSDEFKIYSAFETIMTIKGYDKLVWQTLDSFIPFGIIE